MLHICDKTKVLFPDAFASAIWDQGRDVFEHIFFGRVGRDGAASFWANARERCPWYPRNIPEDMHSGLIPVSLYGDEVHAYRNTDPGAVSVVGWTSDFAYGVEALLQYNLLCVFSEYVECSRTYDDLMEALLPRFQKLCDPLANHPWQQEFRFVLCGVRGDLKWINDRYKIHNYRTNSFCSRCNVTKVSPTNNVYATITTFSGKAEYEEISHESFCANLSLEEWPLPVRYGVQLTRFCHDTCHSQLLGTGKVLNGSALIYLCEKGFFVGGQLGQGVYDVVLQEQLRAAYVNFKAFNKEHGLRISHPRFTFNRVNRKHRGMQPCSSKESSRFSLSWHFYTSCNNLQLIVPLGFSVWLMDFFLRAILVIIITLYVCKCQPMEALRPKQLLERRSHFG